MPAAFATHVEAELARAVKLTAKDYRQRWVTMDGAIHTDPVPFRDAISVRWIPLAGCVAYAYRDRVPAPPAEGL